MGNSWGNMGEGKVGRDEVQDRYLIPWDLLVSMRSTGTNGGGSGRSVFSHSFHPGSSVLGRHFLHRLIIPCFLPCKECVLLGGKSLSVYCSLPWEFSARVGRKWETRGRAVSGCRGGTEGL